MWEALGQRICVQTQRSISKKNIYQQVLLHFPEATFQHNTSKDQTCSLGCWRLLCLSITRLAAKSRLHSSSHSNWNCLLSDLCTQQCNGRVTNPACQGIITAVSMYLSISCPRTCLSLPILLPVGWKFNPNDAMLEVEGSSTSVIRRGEGTEELIVCTATLPKNKKRSYHSVSYRALCIQTSLNEGLLHASRIAI